jgi:hypothetical protein
LLLGADLIVFPAGNSHSVPVSSQPAAKSAGSAAESASPAARNLDSANSAPVASAAAGRAPQPGGNSAPIASVPAGQVPQVPSAPAVTAPQGLTVPAIPSRAADSAAPQLQATTAAAPSPPPAQAIAPTLGPSGVPAPPSSQTSHRSLLRLLEYLSAIAFATSLGFYFWKSRSSAQ